MENKFKVLLGVSAFLFSAITPVTYASLIAGSDGTYVTDSNTNLNWLKLSLTADMSVADALNAYSGWSLATEAQFHTMFDSLAGPRGDSEIFGFVVPDDQHKSPTFGMEYIYSSNGFANYTVNSFSAAMGYTSQSQSSNFLEITTMGVYESSSTTLTYGGVLATQRNPDPNDSNNDFLYSFYDWDEDYSHLWTAGESGMGTYLVRDDTTTDPTPTPEPHILALFGAGLLGLGIAYRRKLRQL